MYFHYKMIIISILKILVIIVPLLISVAYLTLLERKVMASIQRRKKPDYHVIIGLLQPFANDLKLYVYFLLTLILLIYLNKGSNIEYINNDPRSSDYKGLYSM